MQRINTIGKLSAATLLSLLIMIALSSCSSGTSSSDSDPYIDGDTDLAGDEPIDDLFGLIGVELVPPSDTGFQTQQIVDVDLDDFDGVFVLRAPVDYSGEVQGPDREAAQATISLVPVDEEAMILGHSLRGTTLSTSSPEERDGKASFQALIHPGMLYSVYIFPVQEDLAPPIVLHNELELEQDSYRVFRFEDGLAVSGSLSMADGSPVKDARISAYSRDPWRRSSVALSDHRGYFTLLFGRLDGDYDIVVEASEFNRFLPTLSIRGNENNSMAGAVRIESGTLVEVAPSLDGENLSLSFEQYSDLTCLLSGTVYGKTDDASETVPIAGTTLRFRAKLGGGQFEVTATSDDQGRYSAELIRTDSNRSEDAYEMLVLPPVEGINRIYSSSGVECSGPSAMSNINLTERILLSGKVSDEVGDAIPGAEIQAHKLPTETDTNVIAKSAYTDVDGNYSLAIDPGLYDLIFRPPSGLELAQVSLRNVETSTDATVDQTLMKGRRFSGTVINQQGDPVPWVDLEAFRLRAATGLSESIAKSSSGENGEFLLILP